MGLESESNRNLSILIFCMLTVAETTNGDEMTPENTRTKKRVKTEPQKTGKKKKKKEPGKNGGRGWRRSRTDAGPEATRDGGRQPRRWSLRVSEAQKSGDARTEARSL